MARASASRRAAGQTAPAVPPAITHGRSAGAPLAATAGVSSSATSARSSRRSDRVIGSPATIVRHSRAAPSGNESVHGDASVVDERDLEAATAEVEGEPRARWQRDARADPRDRAPRLLVAGEDVDRHPERAAERLGDPGKVRGVAERRGRDREHALGAGAFRDVAEPGHDLERAVEHLVGHASGRGDVGAEVEDHPVAQDVGQRAVGVGVGHEELERRAPEIEHRAPHRLGARTRAHQNRAFGSRSDSHAGRHDTRRASRSAAARAASHPAAAAADGSSPSNPRNHAWARTASCCAPEHILQTRRPPDEPAPARAGDRREDLRRVPRAFRLDPQVVELLVGRRLGQVAHGVAERAPSRTHHVARLDRPRRGRRLLQEEVELVEEVAEPRRSHVGANPAVGRTPLRPQRREQRGRPGQQADRAGRRPRGGRAPSAHRRRAPCRGRRRATPARRAGTARARCGRPGRGCWIGAAARRCARDGSSPARRPREVRAGRGGLRSTAGTPDRSLRERRAGARGDRSSARVWLGIHRHVGTYTVAEDASARRVTPGYPTNL